MSDLPHRSGQPAGVALRAVFVAVALAGSALAQPAPPCVGGTVVTRDDLATAGVPYIHEALRLAGALPTVTVDGFDARPLGLDLPFGSRVRVLLDGAPVAADPAVRSVGLEALPVALAEIESVTVCPGDGVAAGAFGGPWIDVRTARPARIVLGAGAWGNETGDPGPALYFPDPAPNVDRWGPDAEGALAVTLGAAGAWVSVRDRDFFLLDPDLFPRTSAASPGRAPRRTLRTGAVALAAPEAWARAAIRRSDDLAFVPLAGTEAAARSESEQGTVSLDRATAGLRLRGHLHAARLRLGRSEWASPGDDLGWAETRLDAAASVHASAFAGGVRAEHVEADARSLRDGSFDGSVTIGRVWARVGSARRLVAVGATASGGQIGGGGVAQAETRMGALRLGATASARRTLAAERSGPEVWAARGYGGLGGGPGAVDPLDMARAGGWASLEPGPFQVRASVGASAAAGPVALGERGAVPARGVALQADIRASWTRSGPGGRRLRASAEVRARSAVRGDAPFHEAWDRVPTASAALDAAFHPDRRLSLWLRAEARSDAPWPVAGRPDARVPSVLLLDLALSKRAWGNRLRVSVAGRNVLGAEERGHPLGAVLAGRLLVRVEARL